MAKIRKTKRRRLRFEGISLILCCVMCFLWLLSTLFIGTINTSLTMEIQSKTNEINLLKNENKDLNIEIQTLQNKDRVYVLAQSAGLDQNQDNIVAIGE